MILPSDMVQCLLSALALTVKRMEARTPEEWLTTALLV